MTTTRAKVALMALGLCFAAWVFFESVSAFRYAQETRAGAEAEAEASAFADVTE